MAHLSVFRYFLENIRVKLIANILVETTHDKILDLKQNNVRCEEVSQVCEQHFFFHFEQNKLQ